MSSSSSKRLHLWLPPRGGTYLWIIAASAIALSFNNAVMLKDNGALYQITPVTNAEYPLNHSTIYDFNVAIHKCSMNLNCNYVIYNKKDDTLKMYESEIDIPGGEKLQQVWVKQSRKHKYMVVKEKLNWHDARQRCQDSFGDLASITSKKEEELLGILVSGVIDKGGFWIGLNDIEKEGELVWSDGIKYSYTNWIYNEPNDQHGKEDCVVLYHSLKWNDVPCYKHYFFICCVPAVSASMD